MNPSEQRLYQAQSPWTMTSCGHSRSAIVTGMADLMPSFFAGIDAAEMMLRRSLGSPDTTEGMSRMSCPPSMTIFTADQLRKAEFTSIWKMTRDKVNKVVREDACARYQECGYSCQWYSPRYTSKACTARGKRP